jgi:acetoin utilization protein AcuB
MLIHEVMSKPVIAARPDDTIASVYETMAAHRIRHIPVVEDRSGVSSDTGTLIRGIVTDRDLRRATSALHDRRVSINEPVRRIMTRDVIMAAPQDPVEEAARLMRRQKIGSLPVMDGEELVGIVTGMDLLDALVRLTGLEKPSARLEVRLPDEPGKLGGLATFLAGEGINIHSILTYPGESSAQNVILRLNTIRPQPVADRLRSAGYDVTWPAIKPWSR